MKAIVLSRGKVAFVDDDKYESVSRWKWSAAKARNSFYAIRGEWRNKKIQSVLLHRFLMGATAGLEVDHRNGDGLDNRMQNLRVCTRKENSRNRRKSEGKTSAYKGVSWYSAYKKWCASIRVDGKSKYLGCFDSELDASRAYDSAAMRNFGEFARTNRREVCV